MRERTYQQFQYRTLTAADVPAAHGLSARLNWAHRLEDWAMIQRTACGFVAEENGTLIGTAFACNQGSHSSIGLVIVSDEYQGKGIGRHLMDLALDAAKPRTPILNATGPGEPLYASMGFKTFDHVAQHQGMPATPVPAVQEAQCRTLDESHYPDIIALANLGSGMDRTVVLQDLFPDCTRIVGAEVNGKLEGIALLRPFGRGQVIGPVVARSVEQAMQLISELIAATPEIFTRVDIPADCGLGSWLEEVGLKCVDRAPRMSLGTPPAVSKDTLQFALVTQAIG